MSSWVDRAKESLARVKDVRSFIQGLKRNDNPDGSSGTQTQSTNPNTGNVHNIKIFGKKVGSWIQGAFETNYSQLTNFENLLRSELTRRWNMNDDNNLNNAIKQYINSPKFANYNNGPKNAVNPFIDDDDKNIFLFAVLSGMIASISYTNNMSSKDGLRVSITTPDDYMEKFNNPPERFSHPYLNFKTHLRQIAQNTNNNPNGFFVTITTDFSKIPPPPPVKGGGTRVRRETRNRNRNHTRRIRTQRHRYRSVKLAKSRKSRR
jgi:hypothetical protein